MLLVLRISNYSISFYSQNTPEILQDHVAGIQQHENQSRLSIKDNVRDKMCENSSILETLHPRNKRLIDSGRLYINEKYDKPITIGSSTKEDFSSWLLRKWK